MYIPPDVFLEATPQTTVAELLDAFTKTETQIVDTIVADLEKKPAGVADYSKQWAASKREKAGLLRKRLSEIAFNSDLDAKIGEAESLVKYSWLDGVGEASLYPLIKGATLPGVQTIPTGVKGLAHEQSVLLSNVRNNFVRAGNRAHRQAVAEISGLVVSGAMGSKQAVQAVTERLNSTGVAAFVDKSGRRWNTRTYVSMCVATTTHRATVAGKIQTFTALGERFVRVSDHEKDCRLCHPWENKILAISGEVAPPAVATLAHAQAEGLMHPRCRHTVELTIPQETIDKVIGKKPRASVEETVPAQKLSNEDIEKGFQKLLDSGNFWKVSGEKSTRKVSRMPAETISDTMPYQLNPVKTYTENEGVPWSVQAVKSLHRAEHYDPGFSEWLEKQQTDTLLETQKQDVWVAVPETVIGNILSNKRLKSAYETKRQNTSISKAKYMKERKKFETEIMGVPESVDKKERPISGFVSDTPSFTIGQQYGLFQLRMKKAVKGRTTVTFGDSLDGQLRPIQMSDLHEANADDFVHARAGATDRNEEWKKLVKVRHGVITETENAGLNEFDHKRAFENLKRVTKSREYGWDYTEAQIHGGVKLDDIEEIVVIKPNDASIRDLYENSDYDFDWDYCLSQVQFLRQKGLKVRIVEQGTWKNLDDELPYPEPVVKPKPAPAPAPAHDAKKTVPQYLKAVEKGKQHFVTESGAKRTFGMLKDGTLDFDAAPVYTSQPVRTYKPGSQALKDLENLKTVGAELRKELDTQIESRKGEYTWTEKEQQERAEHVKQLDSKLSGIANREWQKYGQTRKKPSQKRFWTWLRKNDQEYVKLEEEWRSESGKLSFGLKKIEEYDRVVREETLKMFEQIRPMGGVDLGYEFPIATPASGKKMLEAMKYAEQSYPREWLTKVHMELDSPIQIFEVERGYNKKDKVIGLSRGRRAPVGGNDLAVTAIHELGHTMENNVRGVKQAEFTFLYERSSRTPIPKRRGTELYFEDNFGDAYSGRFYNRGNKDFQENQEILTTAWQQMIGGHDSEVEYLVTRVEKSVDNDYRDFILGMMAIL